jgi:exopolyphosphatase / guanosine-5'-triphosphate,3'-diphosphate pyrophosphatase
MTKRTHLNGPLAAVDMGSNSFRVEIGQMHQGQYRRIDYIKDTVRLGAGLDEQGHLTEAAAESGLSCLRRFALRLAGFAPGQVRAVATQTLREARNRNSFLLRAQEALGFPIEVISGREEARLIYAGVDHLQPSRKTRLVVDIGGRSTEMILGQGGKALVAESFAVGCVSLTMRYFPQGRITAEGFRAAQIAAGAEMEEALGVFSANKWEQALGSSGTSGAVSQLLQAAGVTDGRITPDALRWCIDACIKAGHVDALRFVGLKPERHAVLPGGLAILYTLASHFGVDSLLPARGALRQGVIIDLHSRLTASSGSRIGQVRDETVKTLQQRFQVDTGQASRVAQLATRLFLSVLPKASAETLNELQWACALHEIGLMVSHHDHHRHSAYLLSHADAAGFSQNQLSRLADLVLAQRGGLRKIEAQLANETFAWQVMAIRLAAIKCHARGRVDNNALALSTKGRDAVLSFSPRWTQLNPRTAFLLNEESTVWEKVGPLRLALQPTAAEHHPA